MCERVDVCVCVCVWDARCLYVCASGSEHVCVLCVCMGMLVDRSLCVGGCVSEITPPQV